MSTGRSPRSKRGAAAGREPAARLPIARVAVDLPLPHLDRPFDYLVAAPDEDRAVPGSRVRVRFAGQLVGGFVLDRADASDHDGRLAFLERVVSPEPVLSPEIAGLARVVADRWAGTFADVVRLAVPPRHAAVEAAAARPPADDGGASADAGPRAGVVADLASSLAAGAHPRVVLSVLPGDWPAELAALAAAALSTGRGVVLVVPDHRDVSRVDAALSAALGVGRHVALTADLGPAERYRRFLALRRGQAHCVVGPRSAVWAPVDDLGLVVVWDDGDDLLAEPRAPYCHARDVAALRAHRGGAAFVLAGHATTAEGASLLATGWASWAEPGVDERRSRLPAVRAAGDEARQDDPQARAARLPTLAWRAARAGLEAGAPVLVQVPRRGYQPALACDRCRTPARCAVCAGPLARDDPRRPPRCRWCGVVAADWHCAHCGHDQMRALVVGARRTAEELGRAFPGATVRTSGGSTVLATVPDGPSVVVATPGAEPVAPTGYAAALLLDAWSLLGRPDLRAAEEALRRWFNAAALVRPQAEGGQVVVVGPGEIPAVQALLRWRPRWFADRELDERAAVHLPPAARLAALTGPADAVRELLDLVDLPAGAEVLGPVPVPATSRRAGGAGGGGGADTGDGPAPERMLVRVPRPAGAALAAALKAAGAVRSARKSADAVRVELDPQQLG